jgi:hypothetical protein
MSCVARGLLAAVVFATPHASEAIGRHPSCCDIMYAKLMRAHNTVRITEQIGLICPPDKITQE